MNFDNFDLSWFGINILAPVAAPLIALWFISMPAILATMTKNIVIKSIGKGELFWAVMGMAASTCYELDSLKSIATDPVLVKAAGWAYAGHIGIIFFAVLMVGLNSLEPVAPPAPPAGTTPPAPPLIPDKFIFRSSIVCLIIVVVTYSLVHTKLTEQEANVRKTAIIKAHECIAKHKGDAESCMEDMK